MQILVQVILALLTGVAVGVLAKKRYRKFLGWGVLASVVFLAADMVVTLLLRSGLNLGESDVFDGVTVAVLLFQKVLVAGIVFAVFAATVVESEAMTSEEINRYRTPVGAAPSRAAKAEPESGFDFTEQVKAPKASSILKQPKAIAAILMTIAIIGLVVWLETGRNSGSLPTPKVAYELLPNEGLTDGLPIAITLNRVALFQIDDPRAGGGGAARAKEVVEALEGVIQDLIDQPGRNITLDEAGEFPAIVQSMPDGSGRRLVVQITEGDIALSEQSSAKWLARTWAERLTDALKLYIFAEAPQFTEGSEFGEAFTTLYLRARAEHGITRGSLEDAYEALSDSQRDALAAFPAPEPEEPVEPAEEIIQQVNIVQR